MTAEDYPMIRIVPSRLMPSRAIGRRRAEVLVYFGIDRHEFSAGLEVLHQNLLGLEAKIIQAAVVTDGIAATYLDTILDEDRSDVYKLMALRFDLEG